MTNFDYTKTPFHDTPHPTDPNKSFLKDLEGKIDNYTYRKNRKINPDEHYPTMNVNDVNMIQRFLKQEYFPKPVAKHLDDDAEAVEDTKATEKFEPDYEKPVYREGVIKDNNAEYGKGFKRPTLEGEDDKT